MAERVRSTDEPRMILDYLLSRRGSRMDPQQKLHHLRAAMGRSDANGEQLAGFLLGEVERLRHGLLEAQQAQEGLKAIIEKCTAPPYHPAIFMGSVMIGQLQAALVNQGGTQFAVAVGDEVDVTTLETGDEVLLGNERNVLLSKSSWPSFTCGETAVFDRYTANDRLVIKWRDEEIVVSCAGRMKGTELKRGDGVRWDRNTWLAMDTVERPQVESLFSQEMPTDTFDEIGGHDDLIAEIKMHVQLHLEHADTANRFRVRQCGAITFEGPPGNGKTKLAKATANWMGQLGSSRRCHFINVKPGSLKSKWYAETEANIRRLFNHARELAELDVRIPVLIFMDEIDALATARSSSMIRIDDRVQQAFADELNGFESRGNVMVICATNRIDALDPALIREGRLGDSVIHVPRPGPEAARSIFHKYFPSDLPYAVNGTGPEETRLDLIETAMARLFAPNGSEDLAVLGFRDGRRMPVTPRQLISGAMIESVANDARRQACMREVRELPGPRGIHRRDLEQALTARLEQSVRMLTPQNCRNFLNDLPEDTDVVSVDRPKRRQVASYRYLVGDEASAAPAN